MTRIRLNRLGKDLTTVHDCLTLAINNFNMQKALVEGLHLSYCGDGHYLDHWSSGDRS